MRFQSRRGTREERASARRCFEKLAQPEAALALFHRHVFTDVLPARALCTLVSEPLHRFLVRAEVGLGDDATKPKRRSPRTAPRSSRTGAAARFPCS